MARLEGLFQNHCFVTALVLVVLALLVVYKTVQTVPLPTNSVDATSIELAHRLIEFSPNAPHPASTQPPTVAPGYALALAVLANIDPELKQELSCTQPQLTCTHSAFRTVFVVHYVLALLSLIAIFVTAWALSRSWSVALLTLILAFVAGSYGGLAGQLSPHIWSQSLMLLALMCLALGSTRDDLRWTLVAGGAFGLTALFMPQVFIVALTTALSFWLLGKSQYLTIKHPRGQALAIVVGVALATAILFTSPWSIELANTSMGNLVGHLSERVALSAAGFQSWIAYLIATPGIFMRGLWVGTPILTLLGLVHLPSLLKFSREDARIGPTLLVAIPILSLVVINTLVTANRPETNVGLVFLLTYATAYLVGRTDVRRKFWEDVESAKGAGLSD